MSLTIGRVTFNWREIKKLLATAGGLLALCLVATVDVFPEEWKPIVNGIIGVLTLLGVYHAKGPTGVPVIHRANEPYTQPG
jgi:hypothetical protein